MENIAVFKVIVLVCSLAVPHDKCTFKDQNDVDVFAYELTQLQPRNELECGRDAQFFMSGLALKPEDGLSYLKISCVRVTRQPSEKVG
jgi:hypothetical protein